MTKLRTEIVNCNCRALRKAARRISNFYDAELSPSGLRITQFAILANMAASGPITINQLADRLDLDRTTASRNLRPLENARYVKTMRSVEDRRSHLVALTSDGLAKFNQMLPLWKKAQLNFEKINGRETAALLRNTLENLKVRG